MSIEEYRKKVKKLIVEDLETSFSTMLEKTNTDSAFANKLFAVWGRYNFCKMQSLQGLITQQEESTIRSNIINSLLQLVDLQTNDSMLLDNSQTKFVAEDFGLFNGFLAGDFKEITQEAINLIASAKHFRVIGSARQEALSVQEIPIMRDYFEAIQKRMRTINIEEPFYYRRITTQNLLPALKVHLNECLISSRTRNTISNNVCGISLEQDIDLSLTYFIVDDKMIVLNLYTKNGAGLKDNSMILKSYNKNIIENFTRHFTEAWSAAENNNLIINTYEQFNSVIPVNEKIYDHIAKIKQDLRHIPNSSIRMDHIEREMMQTYSRVDGLRKYSLDIDHKLTNGKLLSVFYRYIDALGKNGIYKTISFYEFWKNLHSLPTFINAHHNALNNGAIVVRIYVIDNSKIEDEEYIEQQREIINENLNLFKIFPKNYQFKIFFSSEYSKILHQLENFAIWQKGNESIVFFPDHSRSEGHIGKTSLFFINQEVHNHINYERNRLRLDKAEKLIKQKLEDWEKQNENLTAKQKIFLNKFG